MIRKPYGHWFQRGVACPIRYALTDGTKRDTLSYWLYFQHHPGHERWKILGQRYWSEKAYASFRDRFFATPDPKRYSRDGGPAVVTIPKRRADGKRGLVSEHDRCPPKKIVLDLDSSVSPTHGDQEGTAYNGHFGCTCYHPLFLFNQFGDLERSSLRPGNVHSADDWESVLKPVVESDPVFLDTELS